MMLQHSFRIAASVAAVAVVTACAQNAGPISAPVLPAAGGASTHVSARPLATRKQIYIYAGVYTNSGQVVDVIRAGKAPKIVDTITQGLAFPTGITIDKSGVLYVANNGNATVTEYPAGQNTPSVTLTQGLQFPNDVAVDRSGNLWVSNGANVLEYPHGSQSPTLTLTSGISGAGGIAVDKHGTVYVSCLTVSGSAYVAVFPPGATQPKTTFGQGVLANPFGIRLDRRQNLYVADLTNAAVYVFSPKTYELLRTVTGRYFAQPSAVTIDTKDRLYLGGGGFPSDASLIQIPDLGRGTQKVFYQINGIDGLAADPTIQP